MSGHRRVIKSEKRNKERTKYFCILQSLAKMSDAPADAPPAEAPADAPPAEGEAPPAEGGEA